MHDLKPLQDLLLLEILSFDRNVVEELTTLGSLRLLNRVEFKANQVRDISILLSLANLTTVTLNGNPLNEEARDRHIPALREAGIVIQGP